MTSEQFVYWLQGFAEIHNPRTLSEEQWTVIKDHLKLVFDKQTPDRTNPGLFPSCPPTNPYTIRPDTGPWQPGTVIC